MKKSATMAALAVLAMAISFSFGCGRPTETNLYPAELAPSECGSDSDCQTGEVCTASGQCVAVATGCQRDSDCDTDQVCDAGQCVAESSGFSPVPVGRLSYISGDWLVIRGDSTLGCFSDSDCQGQIRMLGEYPGNPPKEKCANAWEVSCGDLLARAEKVLPNGDIVVSMAGLLEGQSARFTLTRVNTDFQIVQGFSFIPYQDEPEVDHFNGLNFRLGRFNSGLRPCGDSSPYRDSDCAELVEFWQEE